MTACPHALANELVGLRNLYRNSPTEVYEHIYLNENFYSLQCIKVVDAGLHDTDRYYYKIADELYLFVWREKIMPALDLTNHRSDGKIFGYAGGVFDELSNFTAAS